jgi:hypothetical protein
MKRKLKIIIAALLMTGTAIALYATKEYSRKNADTEKLQAAFTLSANELYRMFEADEQAAGKKFNDKVVAVTGTISKIENTENVKQVMLVVDDALGGIICRFDEAHAAEAAAMKPGDHVKIKGVCTGMLLDVILVRCVTDKSRDINY